MCAGNIEEQAAKNKLLGQVSTIERTAFGAESPVNCIFSFQGLKQTLETFTQSAWRLIESKNVVHTLVHLLRVKEEDSDRDADGEDHVCTNYILFSLSLY